MVRPMVHSTKHYVQTSITTVPNDAVLNIIVASSVQVVDKNGVAEVEEGSSIKAVYVEMWAKSASDTVSTSGDFIFYKESGADNPPSVAEIAALGTWDNKKNILYTTVGLFNTNLADARLLFKGWIKIPKSKQRMGLGDRLMMSMRPVTQAFNICGFTTYKEYQ